MLTTAGGFGAYSLTGSLSFSYAKSTLHNFTIGITVSGGFGTPGPGASFMETDTRKY